MLLSLDRIFDALCVSFAGHYWAETISLVGKLFYYLRWDSLGRTVVFVDFLETASVLPCCAVALTHLRSAMVFFYANQAIHC